MKRKIILIIIILLIITIGVILVYPKEEKKILDVNKESNNNFLSTMLESEVGSNKYIESNNDKFSLEGYHFNKDLSRCVKGSKLSFSDGNLYVKGNKSDLCYAYFDNVQVKSEFDYTENYEEYVVPSTGTYKIELWGASGGDTNGAEGGKGAYTKGNIKLVKGDIIYIFIGQEGQGNLINEYLKDFIYPMTYNGGGKAKQHSAVAAASGGGATDVRIKIGKWDNFESLKSRIMVAAGGGGGMIYSKITSGGYGGSLKGGEGEIDVYYSAPDDYDNRILKNTTGGTQIYGGETNDRKTKASYGKFGIGGSYSGSASSGGGGGYYGGAGGIDQVDSPSAGAGGSSFISGYTGCVAIKEESTEDNIQPLDGCSDGTGITECSYHYSGKIFTETQMIAGNETMPSPDGGTEEGHTGNGYAKITLVK